MRICDLGKYPYIISILHRGDLLNLWQYYMGGGLPNLLQYYNRGGEGSTGTPNLYYVINGRPLMRNQYTSEPIMIKCFRLYFTQCTWLSLCVPSDTIRGAHLILGCHTGYMLLQPGGGGLAKESLTNKLSQSNHWLLRNDAGHIYLSLMYLWVVKYI